MTHTYQLDGVRHCYGSRCVVDLPALEVRTGEILGIVGPSGAGKSTLLRLLNFLEPPTRGRLIYRGTEIGPEVPLALRREVVTVFQQPVLLRRSVLANVRIGQRLRGLPRSSRDAEQWLERLGLSDLAHAPARTLSAGEAQRAVHLDRARIADRTSAPDEPYRGNPGLRRARLPALEAERLEHHRIPGRETHLVSLGHGEGQLLAQERGRHAAGHQHQQPEVQQVGSMPPRRPRPGPRGSAHRGLSA